MNAHIHTNIQSQRSMEGKKREKHRKDIMNTVRKSNVNLTGVPLKNEKMGQRQQVRDNGSHFSPNR